MNCRELSNFLADYVSDELATTTKVEFEAHLSKCRNCGAFLTQYRSTIIAGTHAFDAGVLEAIPEDLIDAIMTALDKEQR